MAEDSPLAVIVLAAGAGTRMRSRTPKVLHRLGGRSLLGHAIHAAQGLEPWRISVVVRHQRDEVAAHALDIDPSVIVADQDEVPGTGRAVQCGLWALDGAVQARQVIDQGASAVVADAALTGSVVVLAGDVPLLDQATLAGLVSAHRDAEDAVTVLTTVVDEPRGYGRVVRDADGAVEAVVEERDATDEQRRITEINTSVYVFRTDVLRAALEEVGTDNAQGEVYLTDVLAQAYGRGLKVSAVSTADRLSVEGVNDRVQLATLARELNDRTLRRWMLEGVTVIDPVSTWVDVDVDLAPDVTLLPGVQLHGATSIAEGCTIGPDTTLVDVEVGARATVTRSDATLAVIGSEASVGPYSYLRPGASLGDGGKIGAFVEVKNSTIGTGSKVPHLSYVGDATIGDRSNIGAGTIFVNYDGVTKHHSTVGDASRTGAHNIFIAPVHVGSGSYTGGGTVVRFDVPDGALAVSAGNQRNIEGWTERRRPGTEPAEVAARARGTDGEQGASPYGSQAQAEQQRGGADHVPPTPSEPVVVKESSPAHPEGSTD